MIDDAPTEYEVALETTPAPEPPEADPCDDERRIARETVQRLHQRLAWAGARDPDALGKVVMTTAFVLRVSQSAELMSYSPLFRSGVSMIFEKNGQSFNHNLDDAILRPLFIVGPARVGISANNGYNAMATFRLSPEPYPPTQAMVVPPGTGGATVTLECSTNLVNWSPATNGVYTNLPVAKFFRVKLDKIP